MQDKNRFFKECKTQDARKDPPMILRISVVANPSAITSVTI